MARRKNDKELENAMPYDIDADFQWFLDNQEKLVKRHNGMMLGIRNGEVLGAAPTIEELAVKVGLPIGEYLIQLCIPGEDAYTTHIYTPGMVMA